MRVTIFGGTGRTGRCLVEQSLEEGHGVTVLVRTAAKLTIQHPRLRVIVGNVLDQNKVAEAVEGTDAVLSAFGGSLINPGTVLSQGTQNIVNAMKQRSVKRVVVISAFGIGDSRGQIPLIARLVGQLIRSYSAQKESMEQIVRESALDWIIVRPWRLVAGSVTGHYEVGLNPRLLRPVLYADLADFMLKQLMVDQWLRQTPAIVGS
jgi:putative NADH-flavin reductase